jgi:nucleoside 2-deoxyribosyltransferase
MVSRVYLTDLSDDFAELHPILVNAIREAGMVPVELSVLERHKTDVRALRAQVRQKISEADYVVAVLAFRRGWEVESGQALNAIECDIAHDLKKPIIVLLPEPSSQLAASMRIRALSQTDAEREAQLHLWDHLEATMPVSYFQDAADMARQVRGALTAWSGVTLPSITGQVNLTLDDASVEAFGVATRESPKRLDGLDVESFADRVADKTAARVVEVQQKQSVDLAREAMRYSEALKLHPGELVFGKPATGRQFKADAFMIMPFRPEFDGVYTGIIRPLLGDLKLTIQRGDEFTSTQGVVMEDVWAALNACRFVIAEITGGNDNVFYELGIAHTLNLPAILITQATAPEQVPFDIRHLRYIKYENTVNGGLRLREDLKRAIERLLRDLEDGANP